MGVLGVCKSLDARRILVRESGGGGRLVWSLRWALVLVCGVFGLVAQAPNAFAGTLLFQVKTNKNPKKIYQFYHITKGPEKRMIALRYYRKTWRRVGVWRKVGTKRVRVMVGRYVTDPCYPILISFGQISRGVSILRNSTAPKMPATLQTLLQKKYMGTYLDPAERLRYRAWMKRYCEVFLKAGKGRFVNSLRGYGQSHHHPLHPSKGGYIVVTYLRNGLLNFFRGSYRYIVLRITKQRGTWRLQTFNGRDASKLFFRTFSLGISAIELGLTARRRPQVITSLACRRGIDGKRGTCQLTSLPK